MSSFRDLFRFSSQQSTFLKKNAQLIAKKNGLKLLGLSPEAFKLFGELPTKQPPIILPQSKPQPSAPIPTTPGKIMIIIPSKSGNACARNTTRRRIKEIFYTEKLYLNSTVFVFFVYEEGLNLSYQELKDFLVGHCSRKV